MPHRLPPLESLRVFEACARQGNFSRAAAELGLSPTAVSQRIRSLEAVLDTRLFDRTGPRVALTAAGKTLARGVGSALEGLAGAVADCRTVRPRLRVTCPPTFASRWLIPRLADYQKRPGAETLRLDISAEVRDRRDFDIAIRCGTGPWAGLDRSPLFLLDATPIVSPACASRLTRDPASLASLTLLADAGWRDWFDLAGVQAPTVLMSTIEYPNQDVAATAVLEGQGAGLLSPTLFATELAEGRLLAPFPVVLRGPAAYWLLSPPDRPATDFTQWLAETTSPSEAQDQTAYRAPIPQSPAPSL